MPSLSEPNMARLQILGAPQSPFVWSARMVAAEKGIEAELINARPHSTEIEAIQPFGKMPVLRHGGTEIGESRAIALYIDGLSAERPLMPRDLAAAARTEQWIMHYHTEFAPTMVGRYIVPWFFPRRPGGTRALGATCGALPPLERLLGLLERRLDGRAYVAGEFTLADIFFGPPLHYLNVLPEGSHLIAASPRVAAYLARLAARPAFQATFPPPPSARAAA